VRAAAGVSQASTTIGTPARDMKIWIDLDNSPAALLFSPIVRRLESLGHTVGLTARDNAQTVELARARWPGVVVVGGPSPPRRWAKVGATVDRVRGLRAWARRERPDVALSHNSYAQIVAARSARIPVVTAMDYEHQPANHLGFRLARTVLLPEAMRDVNVRRLGASPRRTRFYPGLKEEVYLGDFEPRPTVLEEVGVSPDGGGPVVVARTPPDRAFYHQFANPLFLEALRAAGSQDGVRIVVLIRYPEQRAVIEGLGLPDCRVPDRAVDSRSLMYAADVVIGAGGTMTREAALLGARTYSVYAGASPAVDRWLERHGRLTRLSAGDQVLPVRPAERPALDLEALRARGDELTEWFVQATVEAAG